MNDLANERVPFGYGDFEDQEARVWGVVFATNGTPIEDASVDVKGESISDVTDASGVFILYGVPWGEQTLLIERTGYVSLEYTLYIMGDVGNGDIRYGWGPDHRDNDDDGDWDNDDDDSDDRELTLTLREGADGADPDEYTEDSARFEHPMISAFAALGAICALVTVLISVIVAISAVHAYRRQKFGFAIVGAVLGMFIAFIIPGLIALILLVMSRDQFEGYKE
jgi:hypothetical protein